MSGPRANPSTKRETPEMKRVRKQKLDSNLIRSILPRMITSSLLTLKSLRIDETAPLYAELANATARVTIALIAVTVHL